jgi:phosphoribosylpyrophosphate synthetase
MKLYIEGVRYNKESDSFEFDWSKDAPEDLLNLKLQSYNKKLSSKNNVDIYYAYKLNPIDKSIKSDLRNSIKYMDSKISSKDLDLMISKAVNNFNSIEPLSSFDIIITPKSSSGVLHKLKLALHAKAGSNTYMSSDIFIKNTIDNIKYDEEKLNKLSDENKKLVLKVLSSVFNKQDYKLKSIPPQYRKFILNFLSFNSEANKQFFNKLMGGKILIVDDIVREGTTLRNMVDLLDTVKPEKITAFALLTNASTKNKDFSS